MGKRRAFLREVFGAKGVEGDLDWHGEGSASFVTPESLVYAGDFLSASETRAWLCFCFLRQRRKLNTMADWPSRETLGVMMGISPRQVTRLIKGLVTKGVLYVRQRANKPPYYLLRNIPESKMNRTKERLPKSEQVTIIQKRANNVS
jgi:hypothetical protein